MAIDFRASQVQTNKIISSGSTGTGASLMVYPISAQDATSPNQGVLSSSAFWTGSIGTDVFLYVSGSTSSRTVGGTHGTSVFGGDLVVSGNLQIVGTSNIAGAQWLEVSPSPKLSTTASVAIGITGSALYGGSEGVFFVSGTTDLNLDGTGKYAIFGGTVRVSGCMVVGDKMTTPAIAMSGGLIAFTAIAGAEGTGILQLAMGADSNAGAFNITAYSPGNSATAFTGSTMYISAGNGGTSNGSTAGAPGGGLRLKSGNGGGAGSAGNGGLAGGILLQAGAGGAATTSGNGGNGGVLQFLGGTGGTGSTGGAGSTIAILAGTGGSGSATGGSGGSITINVGRSGSAGGSNGTIMIGGATPTKVGFGVSSIANGDTFIFVSGGANPVGQSAGMTVYQGDVLISGSLIAQQAVTGVLVSTNPVSIVLSERWDTLEISGAHANQLLISGSNSIPGHRSWEIILGTSTSGSLLFVPPSAAGNVTASVNSVTTASYPFPGGTLGAVQVWTITQISSSTVGALTGSTLRYYIS